MQVLVCEKCGKTYSGVEPLRCFCDKRRSSIVQQVKDHINKITINTSELWKRLHLLSNDRVLYEEWKCKLPCGPCKASWQEIQERIPPDFSSQDLFFEWTVIVHNEVNKKLGKRIVSLEEARNIWKGV